MGFDSGVLETAAIGALASTAASAVFAPGKPGALPPLPPPPAPPPQLQAPTGAAASADAKRRASGAAGLASTIATGPQGLTGGGSTTMKSLLGD